MSTLPACKGCPNLHHACRFCHFDCMKRLIRENKDAKDKKQSALYFDILAVYGTYPMIEYLIDNGYYPRWASFYSLMIAHSRIDLLQHLYQDHFFWSLDYSNNQQFILNIEEHASYNDSFIATLLYFINYADITPSIYTIVSMGFTSILDLLRPCIAKVSPEIFESYDQARKRISQLLHIKAVLLSIDKENIKYIYTYNEDYNWCMAEDYPSFSSAFRSLQIRKHQVIDLLIELDIVPKDIIKYIISLYLLS